MLLPPLFRLIARLPLSWVHRLGGWAGWLVWWCSAQHRERLRTHLTLAVGTPSPDVLKASIAEHGRQMFELPFIWLRPQPEILSYIVRVDGQALIEAARAQGRSILFLTAHLGCFELCAHYGAQFAPATVLFRPPRQAAMASIMASGRARGNVRIAPADLSGVRLLLKALRSGEMVGILPDQVPRQGEGMWAPFFGRMAWTMTLAARLSELRDVTVLMVWAERLERGRGYVIHVSEPAEPITGTLEARCYAINREIERLVKACPQQYLFAYNRYKRPAGVEPPKVA